MAKKVMQYDLLVSCPGDIKPEIDIIKNEVEQFNELYSDALGVNIRIRHWSKSAYPQPGGKPQDILNNQFIKECDAAVAIFWTRFGTPTDKYNSGSEEEIEIMLESGKQVFMYFSEKPIAPSELDTEQYDRVTAFKSKYKDKGLYFDYNSDDVFGKLFFAHLSQYFLSLPKIEELISKNEPHLVIKSIHDEELGDTGYVERHDLSYIKSSTEMFDSIKSLFSKIAENKFGMYSIKKNPYDLSMYKPVEIKEETKETIKAFAAQMKIEVADDFFNLGDLRENALYVPAFMGGGRSFEGTIEEEQRYNDIIKLKKLIESLQGWFPIEQTFEGLRCIKLVLSNDGTKYDEDIDIELEIKTEMLLHHRQFKILPEGSLAYACDDCSLFDLFEIKSTALYLDYESSRKTVQTYTPHIPTSGLLYQSRNYEEEYRESLDEVFDYQYYQQGDITIVKLRIDYVKQHTSVAFPTPIFVTDKHSNIKYSIRSKHNPNIVTGEIIIANGRE